MKTSTKVAAATAAFAAAAGVTLGAQNVGADLNLPQLKAELAGGVQGDVELALQNQNGQRPTICFVIDADGPEPGDSVRVDVLRGGPTGPVAVDLGSDVQWLEGSGDDCDTAEKPGEPELFADIFANPANYSLKVTVVVSPDDGQVPRPGQGRLERD